MKAKREEIVDLFVKELNSLQAGIATDPYWSLIFSDDKSEWCYLRVSLYNRIYYVYEIIERDEVQIHKNGKLVKGDGVFSRSDYVDEEKWYTIFENGIKCIRSICKNPLAAYSDLINRFPYKYKTGTVQKSILWQLNPDIYRYDEGLSVAQIKKFISQVRQYKIKRHSDSIKNLTARRYFEICKVAYLHSNLKLTAEQKLLTGRELYKKYADGRHEGLLDINENSVKDFELWIDKKHPKYTGGGHPWEILRGGNTTKISLSVEKSRYEKECNYELHLWGPSSVRLVETIKILMGFVKNDIPVAIDDPELICKRLVGEDIIGIVPEYSSLHRANQSFDQEDLHDVMYLHDLGKKANKAIAYIAWEQIPFTLPKKII
jgi:hypothetical protein